MTDVIGPIDHLLLQYPDGADTGPSADAMLALVEAGTIAVYDLVAIRREPDGSFDMIELTDLTDEGLGGFRQFHGARSGLLGEDDVAAAAGIMDDGSTAVLIIYENRWAVPFVAAAGAAGAEVIASERIPAAVVMEVLDELEAALADD
jgi:hypothetical protein